MATLGQRLVQLREFHNIKQKDIADYLGITVRGLRYYETDVREPNIKTLIALANYFNVSLDYLLGISDIPRPIPANIQEIISKATNPAELLQTLNRILQKDNEESGTKGKIDTLVQGLDEESVAELKKYAEYLKIRQTLDSSKNEDSAGLDIHENRR
jgi:transcriptional regulator with XRE-family HTH domain